MNSFPALFDASGNIISGSDLIVSAKIRADFTTQIMYLVGDDLFFALLDETNAIIGTPVEVTPTNLDLNGLSDIIALSDGGFAIAYRTLADENRLLRVDSAGT